MDAVLPLFELPGKATLKAQDLLEALYRNNEVPPEGLPRTAGHFAVGANRFWHGGIHLYAKDIPIRAIADGEVVAYRINKAPLEADLGDGGPTRKFSNGLVVVRHRLVTPLGGELRFFSISAHLLPVTEEESRQESDSTQAPWIFRNTGWVVSDMPHGSGLPVVDAECRSLTGVIPFGAQFKVLPEDEKCQKERYRKISVITALIDGYVALNEAKLTNPTPQLAGAKGRIYSGETVTILDDRLACTGNTVPKNAFVLVGDTPASFANLRYRKVVAPLTTGASVFIENLGTIAVNATGTYYRTTADSVSTLDSGTGAAAGVLAKNTYLLASADAGALPATHWTKKPPFAGRNLTAVTVLSAAKEGFALLDPVKPDGLTKTAKNGRIDSVDSAGAATFTIEAEHEYLLLNETPPGGSVLEGAVVKKISYPDPSNTNRAVGWAFLRAGKDFTPLVKTAKDNGALCYWGRPTMTSDLENEVLIDETKGNLKQGAATIVLKAGHVFELLPDPVLAAGHWVKSAGWHRVSFTYEARQGQPALTIEGHSWLGRHATEVGTVAAGAVRTFKLKHRDERGAIDQPLSYLPYKPGIGDQAFFIPGHSYAWNGKHEGLNVYESADAHSRVLTVLEVGTVLSLKAPPAYAPEEVEGAWVFKVATPKFCELSDGGFLWVDGRQVAKRAELPKPIEFDALKHLAQPIPVRRGDILGLPGPSDAGDNVLHFEVVVPDLSFTENQARDRWGPWLARIPTEAAWYLKKDKPPVDGPKVALGVGLHVEIAEKAFRKEGEDLSAFYKVAAVPRSGWVPAGDVELDATGSMAKAKKNIEALRAEDTVEKKEVKFPDGTKKTVKTRKVKTTSAEVAIHAAAGETFKVLASDAVDVADAIHVEFTPNKVGWVERAAFAADTKNLGNVTAANDVGVYRFQLKAAMTLPVNKPMPTREFAAPSDAEKEALCPKVDALPRSPSKGNGFFEVDGGPIEELADTTGKTYLGVSVDGGTRVWFLDTDPPVERVSRLFAWTDWKRQEETARADDPSTPDVDESRFSRDGFCDVAALLDVIDAAPGEGKLSKLRRFACAHPSEWDTSADESLRKWERLLKRPYSFSPAQYEKTKAYIQRQQWWTGVPELPSGGVWHLHPLGFVEHVRSMGLVTVEKLVAIFAGVEPVADLRRRMAELIGPLCDTLAKYEVNTPLRIAHFIAQIGAETGALKYTSEQGNNAYFMKYENRPKMGHVNPGDGRTFYGRGYIQLTGRKNYERYEQFVCEDVTSSKENANKIAMVPRFTFDSAGFYWRDNNLNALADNAARARSDEATCEEIARAINGGSNGLGIRVYYFKRAKWMLCTAIDLR